MDGTASGGTVYARYSYLGSGTIVKVAHPQITGGLNLTYDPLGNHSYTGFDRFGRVLDQRWAKTDGTVVDQIKHGYDLAGNRIYREVAPDLGTCAYRKLHPGRNGGWSGRYWAAPRC